jgi:peptide/nickel transport system permease protein
MHPIVKYVIQRFLRMLLTIWIGLTLVFIVSRLMPFNPADILVARILSLGTRLRAEEIEAMRNTIYSLFGLGKPIHIQYFEFLYRYLIGDMGPSFTYFPTKVSEVIAAALPYTIFLLLLASITSWVIGNVIGVVAALSRREKLSRAIEYTILSIQPIPFAVFALAYLIFYVLVLRLSIPAGEVLYGRPFWYIIRSMFQRSLPPLTAMLIWNWMGNFLSMKSLAIKMKNEDFIDYAKLRGASRLAIVQYVARNAIVPQFTYLLLGLGMMFTGNALVEYLFSYPGIGILFVTSIVNADYNLMLGIAYMSIVGVAIAAFLLDIIYPLIDPRIRYPGQ